MILVIGGTADGRQLADYLNRQGFRVKVSVTTVLGASLLQRAKLEVVQQKFTADSFQEFLLTHAVQAVVDASHPFAVEISSLAVTVCAELAVPCVRYERPRVQLPAHPLVHQAVDWQQAAQLAMKLPGKVFLAVGVKPLTLLYQAGLMAKKSVIARVLPEEESIAQCKRLGVEDIVALRGVASRQLNRELFKQYQADVIMTKDSGTAGGTEAKVQAALDLGVPIIVVNRPVLDYQHQAVNFAEVKKYLTTIKLTKARGNF